MKQPKGSAAVPPAALDEPLALATPAQVRAFADYFFLALRALMDDFETVSATITHGPNAEFVILDNGTWSLCFEVSAHLSRPHILVMLSATRLGLAGALAGLTTRGSGANRSLGFWSGGGSIDKAAQTAAAALRAEVWSDRALADYMRDHGKSKPLL
jgi:hypothetical protein